MTRFVRPSETIRIYLREFDGSDDWVDVKADLSYGDYLELKKLAVPSAKRRDDGSFELQINTSQSQIELMSRAIVAWSFKAAPDDPSPLPATRELISQLQSQLGEWLAAKIDAIYAGNRPNFPSTS